MYKYLIPILLLLLPACEDCSKPTRKECASWYPVMVPVVAGKTVVMSTIMMCSQYIVVPNECYKEPVND